MIFAVVIPPSALGKLLEEVVRALIEATLGKIQHSFIDKAESLPVDLLRDPAQHMFLTANAPNPIIAKQLIECRIPIIALADDPREVVKYVKMTAQPDFGQNVRRVSLCLAFTHDLFINYAQFLLDRRICSVSLRRLLLEIASFYKLPLTEASLSQVLMKLLQTAHSEDCSVGTLLKKRSSKDEAPLSQFEEDLIKACLTPYRSVASRKAVTRLEWPGSMFRPPDKEETYHKSVSLLGKARMVIFGPYLYLSRGRWKATPFFSIDDNDSGNMIIIDIFDGKKALVKGRSVLPKRGRYSCELFFEIEEPCHLEIRFSTAQGAIEGTFTLEEVMIERA